MGVPHDVLAGGWIPFVVIVLIILIFSFFYVRCYQHRTDRNCVSTVIAFLGLAVALATCALVPVDIFLVSFMKNADGSFKSWAVNATSRQSIEDGVLYTYYALYGCLIFFIFFLLPFSFFYSEEPEETETEPIRWRCCHAFKYSIIFILVAVVLFIVGAFVPFAGTPPANATVTSDWDFIKNIFVDLGNSHAENAISFMMSAVTLFAMFPLILYLGCGMAMWPIDLIKGRRSARLEYEEVEDERAALRATSLNIRSRTLSSSDRRRISELDEQQHLIERRSRHLQEFKDGCWRRCAVLMRPFEIAFGILFLLLALLVFASLLLVNIDKILHSEGPLKGYILTKQCLPHPIDKILLYTQAVFPIDYILIIGLVLFLFVCSMAAIKTLGIWCCWIKMYKIRFGRTRPQALLFLCFLLMLIVLALNVLVYSMAPQYGTFGSQHYVVKTNMSDPYSNSTTVLPCSASTLPNDCIMTRMSMLLVRFIYKLWFFGAAYYWASWVFLAMFVVGLVVSILRSRRSAIDGEVDENEFDSDDDMITA